MMGYKRKREQWKTIEGYPNYKVSNYGRVVNITTGKILKCGIPGLGRPSVNLYNSSGQHTRALVYRLVAKAFIDNPHNYPEVNHINGSPWDSYFENLEWCTPFENKLHCQYFELMENGQAKKDDLMYIKLPYPHIKGLYSIMKRDHIKISEIIKNAVDEYIERHKTLV